jgi:hypothetical protein
MPKRRDRHSRGMRGPLARPNPVTGDAVPVRRLPTDAEFFVSSLDRAVKAIQQAAPDAFARIDVGVEDVPMPDASWASHRVPLAAALEPSLDHPGQIVLFRRPLEHRASTRRQLRVLIFRTVVEQLAAITSYTVEMLDPRGISRDDWE